MKLKHILPFIALIISYACSIKENQNVQESPYNLVNPFIGTGGHGHTYPGATLPFGMVQLSPDTRLTGWDGCSGYHYSDSVIYGFSHTHLSGTGISDYGDVLLMPFNADSEITYQDLVNHRKTPSSFKKESEHASPGYYRVHLDKPNVDVALTTTLRTGIHKYRFNNPTNNKILVDLRHRDKVLDYELTIENDTIISGFRRSEAWAKDQHVYFYMVFSKPFKAELPLQNNKKKAYFKILSFANGTDSLLVKVGISAVSIEGAKANVLHEANLQCFNDYLKQAKQTWSKALDKIRIKSKDKEKLAVFYTALYHTMLTPNTFSDVNGSYRGLDKQIHIDTSHTTYTVFSLWDTFRAAHPLYTLIEQAKTNDFINTFLKHYEQGGRLPVWELSANETDCMIGYHSVSVITDAYIKGIRDFNQSLALEAMKHSANMNHFGLKSYKTRGYISAADESESVSKTLEYAYDDWTVAQFAKALNDTLSYQKFIKRAQYYKNIFDPGAKFMRARINGGWLTPFDPAEVNFNFTEANSWQYSLFAPQDITGLIELYGGASGFEKQLDGLFTASSETKGRQQADITGLIGQYAHGNEPSHHMAYLYNYIGKPWKTQERVNQIVNEQYWNAPDGLSGNEDCGQMSAWYVLSASGIYAVTPGLPYYSIGTPAFDEVTFNFENGKSFIIKAPNLSKKNKYIQSASLNGSPYQKSFIAHETILKGGELILNMNTKPGNSFGVGSNNVPIAEIKGSPIVPVPFIEASKKTFTDTLQVLMGCAKKDAKIYYKTTNAPTSSWVEYTVPITLKKTEKIYAVAISKSGQKSKEVHAEFLKIKGGRSIHLYSKYDNQYAAEGNDALIDQLKGSNNFRTGFWQGYQGQDVVAVVDLGKKERVTHISAGFLQDIRSWIWFPSQVLFYASQDGKHFKLLKTVNNDFDEKKEGSYNQDLGFDTNLTTRYIKMEAINRGPCPSWHLGAGGKSWIFVDEISIE